MTRSSDSGDVPVRLRTDSRETPLGLGNPIPGLSWCLDSGDALDVHQTAFEVRVTDENELIWASGRTDGGDSIDLRYGGPPLVSRHRYEWEVRAWTNARGEPSQWSEPSWWEMGLLQPED